MTITIADIDALEAKMEKHGRVSDHRLNDVLHHAAVPDHWESRYDFFWHVVALRKPSLCLELGCYRGVTSAYMCAAAEKYGGHVIGIDLIHQNNTAHLMPNLFRNWHFLHMDTRAARPQVEALVEEYGPIGVVWQDSSHEYAQSKKEWDTYFPMLDQNALWLCDDINLAANADIGGPNISDYWNERVGIEKKEYRHFAPFRLGANMGIVIVNPPTTEEK